MILKHTLITGSAIPKGKDSPGGSSMYSMTLNVSNKKNKVSMPSNLLLK
jgi:hypothetical protein